MPLIAVQLLWLNLVANGLQDVALAFEPAEGGELNRPPRKPTEPIFERHIIQHVLVIGGVMGVLAFCVFAWLINNGIPLEEARNMTLMQMVLFGNIHAFCARSELQSVFAIRFFSNPFLMLAIPFAQLVHISAMYLPGISDVLQLQPITLWEWSILAAISLLLLIVEELHKAWLRSHQ
jgi:magnesium-transporting ATPase (P-type)